MSSFIANTDLPFPGFRGTMKETWRSTHCAFLQKLRSEGKLTSGYYNKSVCFLYHDQSFPPHLNSCSDSLIRAASAAYVRPHRVSGLSVAIQSVVARHVRNRQHQASMFAQTAHTWVYGSLKPNSLLKYSPWTRLKLFYCILNPPPPPSIWIRREEKVYEWLFQFL